MFGRPPPQSVMIGSGRCSALQDAQVALQLHPLWQIPTALQLHPLWQIPTALQLQPLWKESPAALQLQPLWRTPAAAVSSNTSWDDMRVMAHSCNPYGESLLQL